MIDTDDPQHWPGDSGAVDEATFLPTITGDEIIRAWFIADPYTAVTYVSQLP